MKQKENIGSLSIKMKTPATGSQILYSPSRVEKCSQKVVRKSLKVIKF